MFPRGTENIQESSDIRLWYDHGTGIQEEEMAFRLIRQEAGLNELSSMLNEINLLPASPAKYVDSTLTAAPT